MSRESSLVGLVEDAQEKSDAVRDGANFEFLLMMVEEIRVKLPQEWMRSHRNATDSEIVEEYLRCEKEKYKHEQELAKKRTEEQQRKDEVGKQTASSSEIHDLPVHKKNFVGFLRRKNHHTVGEHINRAFIRLNADLLAAIPDNETPRDFYAYNAHMGECLRLLSMAEDQYVRALEAYYVERSL